MKNKAAQQLGRKGGKAKTIKKSEASRKNGATQRGIKKPYVIEVSFFMAGSNPGSKWLAKSGDFLVTKRGAWRFEDKAEAEAQAKYCNDRETGIESRFYEVVDTQIKSNVEAEASTDEL